MGIGDWAIPNPQSPNIKKLTLKNKLKIIIKNEKQ